MKVSEFDYNIGHYYCDGECEKCDRKADNCPEVFPESEGEYKERTGDAD